MISKIQLIYSLFIIGAILINSCQVSSSEIIFEPTVLSITEKTINTSPTINSTIETPTPTPTTISTPTMTNTNLPKQSKTTSVPTPPSTVNYIGTPILKGDEVINNLNAQELKYVAQWGKGTILGIAFVPGKSNFVVGSAFGIAIYDLEEMNAVPIWIPFDNPFDYEFLNFDQNGDFIRLKSNNGSYMVLDFPTGKWVRDPMNLVWIETVIHGSIWGEMILDSPDGIKTLKSHSLANEDLMYLEYSIREIYDNQSGELLFTLPDETFYVMYNDVHQPEGCDLNTTSVCGNVFIPNAFHPYEGSFSSNGDSLTILYRAPNYGNVNRFSVLRIYDSSNGRILGMVGSFDKPIQTFSYDPSGTILLVAYVDGSIQLWNIKENKPLSGAWHFNDVVMDIKFSENDSYLLLKRPDTLEIRSTKDGSLRSRYEALSYAMSPISNNIIAITTNDNEIKILELDSGKTVSLIKAHEFKIFSIAFSPDGQYIASSGQDCTVKLWDANTGDFIHYFEDTWANGYQGGLPIKNSDNFSGNSRIFIYFINFIKGTNQVMGFGSWGTMVSWNINSGATNYVIYSSPLDFYNGMITVSPHYPNSFSVDIEQEQIMIGNKIYNLQNGKEMDDLKVSEETENDCYLDGLKSSDGTILFTLGNKSKDGQICILNTQDKQLIKTIGVIPNPDFNLYISKIILSHDGKTLIVSTSMGTVNVYSLS